MGAEATRNMVRMTNVKEIAGYQAFFEEDILVPDTKPDVVRIVSFGVIPRLTEKENYGESLRLGGDFYLDVLYIPSSMEGAGIEMSESRIPFRHEITDEVFDGDIEIVPYIENLEVTIINERKLRMKAVVDFAIKQYVDLERNVFCGFRDEKAEMLEKEITYTDIIEHRKDYIEVKDEVSLDEGMPEIDCIVKKDFRVLETYRQISGEKTILSGSIYYDIMYLGEMQDTELITFHGKIDFTQFIKMDRMGEITASDIFMRIDDVRVIPKKDEGGNMTVFDITVGVSTKMDAFCNKTLNLVEDAYHSKRVLDLEDDEITIMKFGGSGSEEISVREKVEMPRNEDIDRILYTSGEVFSSGGEIDNGRINVQGVIAAEFLYKGFDETGIRSFSCEVPFRETVEVPGLKRGMEVKADFVIKTIEAEKINDHQAELKAEIVVIVKCFKNDVQKYIKNGAIFDDIPNREDNESKLILYITRNNDRLWDIGKRYKTPIDDIKQINGMDEALSSEFVLDGGEKLLIWT